MDTKKVMPTLFHAESVCICTHTLQTNLHFISSLSFFFLLCMLTHTLKIIEGGLCWNRKRTGHPLYILKWDVETNKSLWRELVFVDVQGIAIMC